MYVILHLLHICQKPPVDCPYTLLFKWTYQGWPAIWAWGGGSRTLGGNFGKGHVINYQLERTVATLLTATQNAVSAFCKRHEELLFVREFHWSINNIKYVFLIDGYLFFILLKQVSCSYESHFFGWFVKTPFMAVIVCNTNYPQSLFTNNLREPHQWRVRDALCSPLTI